MKLKAFSTILISLIIGFIIGFFTWGQIHQIRTRDIKSLSSEHSFKERTFSIIEPSDKQKENIEQVLDEYAIKFDSLKSAVSTSYKDLINEYHNELRPFVSDEQMKRLESFPKHFKKRKKDSAYKK